MDMDKAPLLKGLLSYHEENNALFHMPGHKQDPKGKLSSLLGNVLKLDVTEVPGTDNLHYPEGILKESMELLTIAMRSAESRYLVNGSTAGIISMVMGCFRPDDKVLVQRDCHQSVYNAISLSGINPIFIRPGTNGDFGIPTAIETDVLASSIEANADIKGLILTSPSYFGISPDLKAIAEICTRKGIKLLADEAHGSHFYFGDDLPMAAMDCGAYASVCSFHKTLPAMTQASVINLGKCSSQEDRERIRHYLRVFQTSSPSYVLLASLEAARLIMESEGRELLRDLKEAVSAFRLSIKGIPGISLLQEYDLEGLQMDYTRLVLNTPVNGNFLSEILRSGYSIQAEMAMGRNVVFIGTSFDNADMYLRLSDALHDLQRKGMFKATQNNVKQAVISDFPSPVTSIPEREALFMDWEIIPYELAEGRISGEKVTPYPPGVPMVMTGELITKDILSTLKELENSGANILRSRSADTGNIAVIKK